MQRRQTVAIAFSIALVVGLGRVTPAHAFYLHVPQVLKEYFARLAPTQASAQEGQQIAPPPPGGDFGNQQGFQPQPGEFRQMPFDQNQGFNGMQPPNRQMDQFKPGQEGQFGQQGQQNGQFGKPGEFGQGQNGQPGSEFGQGQNGQQQGPGFADVRRSATQMERQLKEFDLFIKKSEKNGITISPELKEKLQKAKELTTNLKSAKSEDDLQEGNFGDLQGTMQELEESRRESMQKQEELKRIKQGMRGMEQGLKQFESNIKRLEKQKITVPTEVKDLLASIKGIIEEIKKGDTDKMEDMPDMFDSLNEWREKLEILSRWPQTLRQVNAEIKRMETALKRSKSVAATLQKKGVDVSTAIGEEESILNKLKATRDDANSKVQSGEIQEATELLESDFFGQTDEFWQQNRAVEMLSNLGKFASQFKREMTTAQQMIRRLKAKKVDTTDLQDLFDQAKTKGEECLAIMKEKDFDQESMMGCIQELEDLGQAFDGNAQGDLGEDQIRPWEQGPKQFNTPTFSPELNKFIPKKPAVDEVGNESNNSAAFENQTSGGF